MNKVRVRLTEHFTERTLAVTRALDEASAKKFVDDFYKYFRDGLINDVSASIEPIYE